MTIRFPLIPSIDSGRSPCRLVVTALAIVATVVTAPLLAADYAYPIDNPYLATIAGTPAPLEARIPATKIQERRLAKRPGYLRRPDVPAVLQFPARLHYAALLQEGPAPLTFVLAGTGGNHKSESVRSLMRVLHDAGQHVIGLPSPTHPAFIVAASTTGVPGEQRQDAADLHAIMGQIDSTLRAEGRSITGYRLTGYSLGALNAAFVAALDAEQPHFAFERTLLINSPVSLYSSISKLDRFLDNVPGGVDNLDRLFDRVIEQLSVAYQRSTNVEFTQDLIFAAFEDAPPTREEMAAVVGAVFRFAAMNLSFTADLVTDFGFLKPRELTLDRRADLSPYLTVALRVGLTDYFHEFFWPEQQRLGATGGNDRFAFADRQGLAAIADFLANDPSIYAIHNRDDIILSQGEIDFFEPVFGDRVRLYPNGGHLGNLTERSVMNHIRAVMTADD